ncbi:MAG: hypothetical protein ISS25_00110 [Nanoarchaeota archaeon]|nr:hypothetical protein [DPANN group archaeon]MBL7116222.1 hypothetical protein [Nanoarchaeota archaeon]
MVFGLFSKTDPICGMKEEKGKGTYKHNKWFCHENCLKEFEKGMHKAEKKHSGHDCCH